ncbi:hypothetical protein N7486_000612 [Penicillium sp. IBT 16267x]|nr:hypothetical protein N7486_000612 [Penicillium sp. IBT 16267x]
MSVPEPTPATSRRNGATTAILTQGNVSQIPRSSYSAVERFMRAPTADHTSLGHGCKRDPHISQCCQANSMQWMIL